MNLFLVLTTEWFEMIEANEKKEEYRDITAFWINRLVVKDEKQWLMFRHYDTVTFQLGYKRNARRVVVEFKGVEIKRPKGKWSNNANCLRFAIKLGDIIK